MKTYILLLTAFITLASCHKDPPESTAAPVTRPVEFTETAYEPMGSFDDQGKPNYLVTKDVVSTNLLSFVSTTIPERTDLRQSHPELLSSQAIADIRITQSSDVFITFLSQGSGLTNTFGYYTYPTTSAPASAKDIKKIVYVFPNAGQGTTLQAGDKVKLGRFEPGTSVGFVLLNAAWDPVTKQINTKAVHFCSNDVLNPEVDPALKKHAVLINYTTENKVVIGFEDLNRTRNDCDHDFNDLVVYATVTP